MGAFKTHLRQYCGPERTPPGYSGSIQFANGFMTQDTLEPKLSFRIIAYFHRRVKIKRKESRDTGPGAGKSDSNKKPREYREAFVGS
jgi:hypothetical protein